MGPFLATLRVDVCKVCADFIHLLSCALTQSTMSWDGYIDNLIAQAKDASGAPHCDKACIIGLDGGAKWTSDGHDKAYRLTQTECSKMFQRKGFHCFHGIWSSLRRNKVSVSTRRRK